MMRNKISVLIISLIVLFSAGALPAVTIEFWTIQTQSDRVRTIQLLADTFEALNPGISVRLLPVDENDLPSRIAVAASAGTLPHVVEAGSQIITALGEEGIIDVSAATEILNKQGKDRFYEGALKMLSSPQENKYYGLPYHGWVQGIWYRKDWFEKEGLNPPDTWDNILKAAETFYRPEKNQYGILVGTRAEVYSEQCFTHFALSNGVRQFNSEGRLVFNSPETLETLKFYQKLAQYNPPGPQSWRARDYYLQGRMAMFFYSTYIMDDLALAEAASESLTDVNFPELKGSTFDPMLVENTGVVTAIKGKQPAGYGAIVAFGIIKKQQQAERDAVKRFIEFMYEPFSYITFLHMAPGGMNPVLREIASMPEYLNDPAGVFKRYGRKRIDGIIEGLDTIGSFTIVDGRPFPESGRIYSGMIIPRMIYSVTIEGQDPEKALEWAEREMRKVVGE